MNLFATKTDEHGESQPAWLAIALVILPVLIDKIGNIIMHWLFNRDEDEPDEEDEEEDEEPKKRSKKKNRERESGDQ